MVLGELAGRGQGACLAERGRERLEAAVLRERVLDLGLQRWDTLERDDQRERHLALAQVDERVLAGAGAEIELVVDRLERDAEVEAVAIERTLGAFAEPGRARAGEHRPAEQRRGLALDDPEVLLALRDDPAAALELERLREDHLVDHSEHLVEQAVDIRAGDLAERSDEQPIAGEDRSGGAE